MKKGRWFFSLAMVSSVGLAGCSQDDLSNSELLKKATAAQEDIQSFYMESDIFSEVGGLPVSQQVAADVIQKPYTMHQTIKMKNVEDGSDVQMESYMLDDKMYIAQDGQWFVQDISEMNDIMESSVSTDQNLKLLKKYKDNWTAERKDELYQIDVDLTGDDLKNFMKDALEQSGQMAQMKEMMDQVDYKKMEYTMTYDAKTYYPKTLDMTMEFEITEGTTFKMTNESTFSKFNAIESIELPEEAKEAQSITDMNQ